MSGAFIWYELLADDVAAAAAFYARVIGWRAVDSGLPGPGYQYFRSAGSEVGGLLALPPAARAAGARPCWLPYLHAPDLEACVAAVAGGGGTVQMPPTAIPGVGRFAMLDDSEGASFYAMTPEGRGESRAFSRELGGHCGWNELHVRDPRAAARFYGRHFGWRDLGESQAGHAGAVLRFGLAATPPGAGTVVGSGLDPGAAREADLAEGEAVGAFVAAGDAGPPGWMFAFNVDDVDAAARRLRAAGGAALPGLRQLPDGAWLLPARDPQGARFALLGPSWGA